MRRVFAHLVRDCRVLKNEREVRRMGIYIFEAQDRMEKRDRIKTNRRRKTAQYDREKVGAEERGMKTRSMRTVVKRKKK